MAAKKSPVLKKKLRMALIGAGGIANAHLTALSKIDEVEVVALADPRTESMREKVEKYNLKAETFEDYKQMLAKVKPDAVNILTPNGLHAPVAIAAAEAGAHVIVEKPMAMTAAEAQAMIDASRKARRKLVVGFQYRFDPRTQFLKQAADKGAFGHIMYGRVQALRRRGIPNWGVFGRKELQGGGPMIDIGVHVLEMCHYVMGSPKPVSAVGMTNTYIGNKPSNKVLSTWAGWDHKTYTVEDIAVGHIRFDNGAVIHIEAMFAGHIEKDLWDFQLMGEKGGCTWQTPQIFTDDLGHMMNMTPAWLPTHQFAGFFEIKLRNFVQHVLYDKPSLSPAEDGLMVQQMLDGIYKSAAQGGKEVQL